MEVVYEKFGCAALKVIGNGDGAAWFRDLDDWKLILSDGLGDIQKHIAGIEREPCVGFKLVRFQQTSTVLQLLAKDGAVGGGLCG